MKVKLEITIDEHGQCAVSGPLNNKGMCYQMLEVARDIIKDHADNLAKEKANGVSPIQVVGPDVLRRI